jgi:hypothetical protein
MSKYKTFIAFFLSSSLLALVISQNRELVFFSKVSRTPEWTLPFGDPLIAISLLVALCFIPALWLPESSRAAFKAWIAALLVSPLPAVLMFFSNSDWGNMMFQYVWALGFGCLGGALLALALGFLIRKRLGSRAL